MIHGGIPFSGLSVGQTFHFPAHAKPGQKRSGAYVKVNARAYAPVKNVPAHGHPWNTYEHDVQPDAHVAPGPTLGVRELAEVLEAIAKTKKQDAERGGGGSNMVRGAPYYAGGAYGWPDGSWFRAGIGGGGARHRRGGGGSDMVPAVPYYLVNNEAWGRPGGGGGGARHRRGGGGSDMVPAVPYYLVNNEVWGRPGGGGAKADSRAKFDQLRSKYLAAYAKLHDHDVALRVRYGGNYEKPWLKASDRNALEREHAAVSRAGDAFFKHLQSISPRDWSYGVPIHWLYEKLSYEDAVRPEGQRLSVVPPLAYGATHPRT